MISGINRFESREQEDATWYENAIAATICLATLRVYGKKKLDYDDVRKKIIDKYWTKGGKIYKNYTEYLVNYKLRYRKVDKEEPRKAVMKHGVESLDFS